jgi:hypothetical protein
MLPNGLLANDKDSNNLDLTASVGTNPSYGTLTLAMMVVFHMFMMVQKI